MNDDSSSDISDFRYDPNDAHIITPPQVPTELRSLDPAHIYCVHCHQSVLTKPKSVPGCLSYLICSAIFFTGGVLGCFLVPFFCKVCQDIKHICPYCEQELCRYKRLNMDKSNKPPKLKERNNKTKEKIKKEIEIKKNIK